MAKKHRRHGPAEVFQMVSEARSAVPDVDMEMMESETRDAGPCDGESATTAGLGGEQVTPARHLGLGLGATGETGGGVPCIPRPGAGTTVETVVTEDGILVTRDRQVQKLRRKRRTKRESRTLQSARGAAAMLMTHAYRWVS